MKYLLVFTTLLGSAFAVPPWGSLRRLESNVPSYAHPTSNSQPFKFPLSNGFPDITVPSDALSAIEKQAHGTLPNGPLPKSLNQSSIADLSFLAANELFEVAYFTSLIYNVTNNIKGYEIKNEYLKKDTLASLIAVQAQEELHAIGVNAILGSAGAPTIKPCEYTFPVDNLDDAIILAATFTDLGLGTLAAVQGDFSAGGDSELIPLVGCIIGQEGEQNGFYRTVMKRIGSELPFLTASAVAFTYNALSQMFLVPGSCPQTLPLPVFAPLKLETAPVEGKDQELCFSFECDGGSLSDYRLVYINQQNLPIVEPLKNLQVDGKMTNFQADFPYSKTLMNGLVIAVVTNSTGPFMGTADVAAATIAGPALVVVN